MANKRLNDNNDQTSCTWSIDETLQLLRNLNRQHISWSAVKIDGKTEQQCKFHFHNMIHKIRKISIAMERLRGTPNGEGTFEEDQKESQDPNRNRQKQDPNKNRQKQDPNRNRQETPKPVMSTPFQLFIEEKKRLGESNTKNRLKTVYTALEDNEKLKWIQMAVNNNEEARNSLTSDERRIFRGEPKKPLKALGFFIQQSCQTKKLKSPLKAYQKLTSEERRKFIKLEEKAKHEYEVELAKFKKRNQEDQHVDELQNVDEVEDVDESDDGGKQLSATTKRKRREISSKLQTAQTIEKPGKKARLVEVSEPVEVNAPVEVNEPMEINEPTRIPSTAYNYYKHFIYRGRPGSAKKTYASLNRVAKRRIHEEHTRWHDSYLIMLQKYLNTQMPDETREFQRRILDEEQNESSDPDDN